MTRKPCGNISGQSCGFCQDTRKMLDDLKEDWKDEIKELREDIKKLNNRLPTWATVVITILVALLSYSVGSSPI